MHEIELSEKTKNNLQVLEKIDKQDNVNSSKPKTIYLTQFLEESKKTENSKSHLCSIFFYLFLILTHTCLIYIIKPLCVLLEIIFLTTIVYISPLEDDTSEPTSISNIQLVIGWLIILLLPLYNFFSVGLKIVFIQKTFFGQIFAAIFILLEILINIPLPFCYVSNLYSVFLYEERGVKQLLAPWMIFFPTDYICSVFEIFRNYVEPGYFVAIGLIKLNEIINNQYQAFLIIILKIMLLICVIRFIGNFVIMIIRIKRVLQNKKKYNKQNKKSN